MNKHLAIYLTDDQRTTLTTLIRAGKAPARTQTRARILLLLDRNQSAPCYVNWQEKRKTLPVEGLSHSL